MKKLLFVILSFLSVKMYAQEVGVLIKEAQTLEQKLNEPDAVAKYIQVLEKEPKNYLCLQKATILTCRIGMRSTDAKDKKAKYLQAVNYAARAFAVDSNNAESYYLLSLVNGRLAEIEESNKVKVGYVKGTLTNAEKALKLNPNHIMSNFVMGKWHYEMVTLGWLKKAAIKTLYGGLPPASIDKSIEYLEKCKKLDPYNVYCYLTIAKAYKEKENTTKMVEVLNALVKLPRRTFDDATYLAEGKKMLEDEK